MIANAVCKEHDKNIGSATALDSLKLKEHEAITKLSRALGGKLLHFYVYGAVEREALVFYFSHPAILMEFKAKKEVILEEMKKIWKIEGITKKHVNFKTIAAKVKPKATERKKTETLERDKADGGFAIHCEGVLATTFKNIAKIICEKNQRYEAQKQGR